MNNNVDYAIIILAAGNSSRLGQPKQLLPYQESNLLTHLINEANKVKSLGITLVLGAYSDKILKGIPTDGIQIIINPNWIDGIGTSIQQGISSLNIYPGVKGCILTVCDQPFISSEIFISMIKAHQTTDKGIVASFYDGVLGTPVLFSSHYFNYLLNIAPSEGARKLLKQYADDIVPIHFEKGKYDIDTADDYHRLMQSQ